MLLIHVETPGSEGKSCFDIRSLATEVYSTSVEVTAVGRRVVHHQLADVEKEHSSNQW